jgi:Nitrile hydratase, alpha chain
MGEISVRINGTMGRIIARAWSDNGYIARLVADAAPALAELAIKVPPGVKVVAKENTGHIVNLVLSATPRATPISPLSEIRDFGEIYRDPRLWSLNSAGRDPVAANRLIDDPVGELAKFGVACPDGLQVVILSNSAEVLHLLLPPRPPEARCSPALLAGLEAGRAPAALRYGRLFGPQAYATLLASIPVAEAPIMAGTHA